ncbi:MAG: class I SAM-dependent methyltransferase [Verrucomicrobiia bacterium]|jgi:SAM-dependent methyltransferase
MAIDDKNKLVEIEQNFEFEHLRYANNYRKAILKEFAPYLTGSVIEIGAGIGQFTQMLKNLNQITKILAIEPLEYYANKFAENLPDIEIIRGTIKSVSQDTHWDGIVSVNVLEHIEDDRNELSYYHNLLKKHCGNLCLFVPARKELYSLLDQDFGHFRRYTREELTEKLNNAGFKIIKLHYFNFIGYFAWLIIFKMFRRREFNPMAVKTFDKCILPVIHSFERNILRPPIGQSLIAIARAE